MPRISFLAALLGAACSAPAVAATVSDPTGDVFAAFVTNNFPGGIGTVPGGFDVRSFSVSRNASNFTLSAQLSGPLSGIGNGIQVIGVDRGAGTARFGVNQPGVLFDSVIVIQSNGAGAVTLLAPSPGAANPLAGGSVTTNGNNFTVTVPLSFLPSLGYGFDQYGFNLWPRLPGGPFSNIADFAPNNAVLSIAPIPEPESWALMISGLGLAGLAMRKRRQISAVVA